MSLRKSVLLLGTVAVIWSLMTPLMQTKEIFVGYNPTPSKIGILNGPDYQQVVQVDIYKTAARTFSIVLGTTVLWFVLPGKKVQDEKTSAEEPISD